MASNRRSSYPQPSLISLAAEPGFVWRVLGSGSLASLASAAVLAWRGRRETGSPFAAINAPAHWLWGRESLRRDAPSLRHTATGALVHHGSSLFWAVFYEWMQSRRDTTSPATVIADAATTTAVAAVVDLKLTPQRLTPGFERRLSRPSLAGVYVAFAAGLALAALARRR
jgi:hypothetical protein